MRSRTNLGRILPAGLVILATGFGAEATHGLRREHVNMASSRSLCRDVSLPDAIAAAKVWVALIGRRYGYELQSRVEVLNTAEIRKQVADNESGLVMLDSVEYLGLAKLRGLDPLTVIAGQGGDPRTRYVLLVKADSGLKSIADLRGKSLNLYSRSDANLGRMWLETELAEKRLGPGERFFASMQPFSKPSAACLPVFFGRTAACVIDAGNLAIMRELNPQLGKQLQPLATSPPLVEVLVALHVQHQKLRFDVLRALLEFDRDPEGRQVLTLLKSSRMTPLALSDLDSVRDLLARYHKLVPAAATASTFEAADPEVRRK